MVLHLSRWRTGLLAVLLTGWNSLLSDPGISPEEIPASAGPPLPRVERTPARQPEVGSPTDTHLDRSPPRTSRGLDLVKMGWSYNCMECHKMLGAKWQTNRAMVEHQDIKLAHGSNRFCLNCHHATNRNAFVDYDGSEISQQNSVVLCAKCHGPTYRDWDAGVHGRRNGYWIKSKGPQTRLQCIQCHDPHQPSFAAMKPLPALRYPARAANGHSHARTNSDHE